MAWTKNKKYFLAAIFLSGVFVAAFYFIPHYVALSEFAKEGIRYYPLSLEGSNKTRFHDETAFYMPRMRELFPDMKFPAGDFELYEHINDPTIMNIAGPVVMSPFFYFGKTITNVVVSSDIFFALVSFALLFILFFVITKKYYISLMASVVFSIFNELSLRLFSAVTSFDQLKTFIKHFIPFYGIETWEASQSDLVKMEGMKPGLPFFLVFLIFLYLAIEKNKKIYSLAAGFFMGLLFYTYYFHWVFAVVAGGLVFLFLLISKEYGRLRNFFWIFFAGGVVSSYYWINYISFIKHPQAQDLLYNSGIEISHGFRWLLWKEYLLYAIAAAVVWFLFKKSNKNIVIFLVPLLISGIVLYNLQIFTGWQNQPSRWGTRSLLVIFNIFLVVLICRIVDYLSPGKRKIAYVAMVLVTCLLCFNGIVGKYIWASFFYPTWTIPQNIINSFKWLDENTLQDSVVMSPSIVTNRYLTLYTHNRTFITSAGYGQLSGNESLERLYITYSLFKVPEEYFSQVFFVEKRIVEDKISPEWKNINLIEKRGITYLFNFKYADHSLNASFLSSKNFFTNDVAQEIVDNYNKYKQLDLINLLGRYKLDYIYYGSKEKEIVRDLDLSAYSFLEKLYSEGGIEIYKINYEKLKKYVPPNTR